MDSPEAEEGDDEDYSDALPLETDLGDYRITAYLGRGLFGITYRAREIKLRRDVAIKEYMPREWARRYPDHSIGTVSRKTSGTFRYGLERFTMEAQNLAVCRQENIVKVHRLLEENCTSYMVMELLEGDTLESAIKRRGTISWNPARPDLSCAHRRLPGDPQAWHSSPRHQAGQHRPARDGHRSGRHCRCLPAGADRLRSRARDPAPGRRQATTTVLRNMRRWSNGRKSRTRGPIPIFTHLPRRSPMP